MRWAFWRRRPRGAHAAGSVAPVLPVAEPTTVAAPSLLADNQPPADDEPAGPAPLPVAAAAAPPGAAAGAGRPTTVGAVRLGLVDGTMVELGQGSATSVELRALADQLMARRL